MIETREKTRHQWAERLEYALTRAAAPGGRDRISWVAKRYKVSYEAARKWLSGINLPDMAHALVISKDLEVSPEWLLTGTGPHPDEAGNAFIGGDAEPENESNRFRLSDKIFEFQLDPTLPPKSINETPSGYLRFQLLDAVVSAGGGAVLDSYPEVLREIEVAEWWARSNLRGPLERVKLMTARGDSMADEISNGDILFIDSSVRHFQGDAIYVINYGGFAKVKQLQAMRDGSMAIVSLNKRYQTETVPPSELEQLHIGGLLLGSMPFKRF